MVIGQWPSIDKGLIKFFLPIPLDRKKGGNRGFFGKKVFFEAAFLIFLLNNSSEDVFLLLLLHLLIVSSSFYLFMAKLGVDVFGKDNAGKDSGDDLGSIGADADRGTKADDLGTGTDADVKADNPGTSANDPGIAVDNPGIATDNSGTKIDDPGILANNLGTTTDNPGIKTDIDVGADNPSTVVSNKTCVTSLFILHHTLFLLAFSSELVITSLPSSLPSLPLTTQRSKPILICSITLIKQRAPFFPMDEIWTPSLNKISLKMNARVRLL